MVSNSKTKLWLVAHADSAEKFAAELRETSCEVHTTAYPSADQLVNSDALQGAVEVLGSVGAMVFVVPAHAGSQAATGEHIVRYTTDVLDLFVQAARQAMHYFSAQSGGQIVVVCDVAGVSGRQGRAAEATASGALVGAVKSMAKELGRYRIGVNAVAFGLQPELGSRESLSAAEKQLFDIMRLANAGSIKELVSNVAHLARGGHLMTGQVLHADDGLIV